MDSKQATAYLIDPLTAPEPSHDTGLNSTLTPAASTLPQSSAQDAPFGSAAKAHARQTSRDHGSSKISPRQEKFPNYRTEALGGLNDSPPPRQGNGQSPPAYDAAVGSSSRRRGSSLKERFPGDESHKPLDIMRRASKKADRAPHLNKRHLPGPDVIDRLDPTINKVPYHHEGPYDAASLARNTNPKTSPLAALKTTNEEALRATAPENIKDALVQHKPLDGVAIVPPGMPDQMGRTLHYREGPNQNTEDGGEVEPPNSFNRRLHDVTLNERDFDGQRGIELSDRPLMSDYDRSKKDGKSMDNRDPVEVAGNERRYGDLSNDNDLQAHRRTGSKGSLKDGLKRRIGSLRRKGPDASSP